MIQQTDITLEAKPKGFHLITNEILKNTGNLPENGLMNIFIRHTSAGLTINENADPSVRTDLNETFDRLAPENSPWFTHIFEGADDMPAHIKASLTGSSVTVPIKNHRLHMGIWQGIYLCEFRTHGGRRKLTITIWS